MAASKPYLICPGNHDLHARMDDKHHQTSDLESLRYLSRYSMPNRSSGSPYIRIPAVGSSSALIPRC